MLKEDGSLIHNSGRNQKQKGIAGVKKKEKKKRETQFLPGYAPVVSMINIFVSALIKILSSHYVIEVLYQMLLWNHTITERFWALSLWCASRPALCLTCVAKAGSMFSNFTSLLLWDTLAAIFWDCDFYNVTCKLFYCLFFLLNVPWTFNCINQVSRSTQEATPNFIRAVNNSQKCGCLIALVEFTSL